MSPSKPPSFALLKDYDELLSPDGHSVIFMEDDVLWENNYVTNDLRKIPQPVVNFSDRCWEGNFSPDGRYVLYELYPCTYTSDVSPDYLVGWGLYISDLQNDRFVKIEDLDHTIPLPLWSPDGKWLAFLSDRDKQDAYFNGYTTDLYLFDTSCFSKIETCQIEISQTSDKYRFVCRSWANKLVT